MLKKFMIFALLWLSVVTMFGVFTSYGYDKHTPTLVYEYSTSLIGSSLGESDGSIISDDYIVTIQHRQLFDEVNHTHENDQEECYDFYGNDPDSYLIEYRNEVQEFYTVENELMIEKLRLDFSNANISYSYFAPFIQIIFDDVI